MRPALPTALLSLALAGCGAASPSCGYFFTLRVSPTSGVADHAAKAPGNQQQFGASGTPTLTPGSASTCGLPALVASLQPQWTSSAPLDVTVSSAQDSTNGLATFLAATTAPVILTATTSASSQAPQQTATVTLTCK